MNVGEAIDINIVLDFFLGLPGTPGRTIESAEARVAAERLADKASKALMAGLDGNRVAAAWPKPRGKGPRR